MRVSKVKRAFVAVVAVVALLIAAIGLTKISSDQAEAQTIEVGNIVESKIALNTEIEIPASVDVDYEGTQKAENGVVVFPDGNIVSAGTIKLNQAGRYQLRYFFDLSDVRYTVVQNVEVYSEYFHLSNPNGGEIIVSDGEDGENVENDLYCDKDGVIANLKSGTTFLYDKVVDLRECGEDGLSEIIELDARYGHFEEGVYVSDCLEGWVRLTDCYDPNIYIELRMQRSPNYTGCLFPGVRTNCQPVTGMDKGITQILGTSRIIELDGSPYRVWQTSGSMNVGMYDMKTTMTTGAVWKYDMETQRVYLSYNDGDNFLVTDLDEPLIYTNEVFFPGFTTGEVYVSIYADGYESAYARTEIVSIGGDNLKAVAGKPYFDTVKPQVTVDQIKTTPTGVYGAVGDVFVLPEATAVDVNLVAGVDVSVYRGYGTGTQTNVSVVDGKITLSERDVYTVVYTATDKAGNEGTALFTVSTLETADHRAVTLQTLQAETLYAGEAVRGLYEVQESINIPDEDVRVRITVESESQTVTGEGEDFTFTPYYAGEYTIVYHYTDGVFEYEKTVTVQCQKSSKICFMDEVIAPRYYLKGNFYAIDDVKAYTFTNGYPEEVETKVYAIFDGGEPQELTDLSKVQITGNSNVYFRYEASNGEQLTTDTVGIIDAEYRNSSGRVLGYDMSKFFVGNYLANPLNDDGKRTKNITFTSNVYTGDNTLSYFNRISGRRFSLEYRIVKDKDNFSALRINLTDAYNEKNKLFCELFKNTDGTYVSVNGGVLKKVDSLSFTDELINVSYDYDSKFLRINNFSCSVDFDASLVYLDIDMVGIKGDSSMIISQINGMSIAGNSYADNTPPDIYVYDFQGDYGIGDLVKVSIPEFSDVISGIDYSRAKLMITCSDGGTIYDGNGKPLATELVCGVEYEFVLDRLAKFYVIYEIYDFNGNNAQKTVTVNCADTEAPTVRLKNLKDGETIRIKAGETVEISFTVSDNVSRPKDITTYIHLYCIDMFSYVPNVSNIKQSDAPEDGVYKEKFVISVKGRYQAQINVQDEEGNRYVKYIDIIVE